MKINFPCIAAAAFCWMMSPTMAGEPVGRVAVDFSVETTDAAPLPSMTSVVITSEEHVNAPWQAEWVNNSFYVALIREGVTESQNVKPGNYRLFLLLPYKAAISSVRVSLGRYLIKTNATIALKVPHLQTFRVTLPFPKEGRPERIMLPRVTVESPAGVAFGYLNGIMLDSEGKQFFGDWDTVPDYGKFKLTYSDLTGRKIMLDDVVISPKRPASRIISLSYRRRED